MDDKLAAFLNGILPVDSNLRSLTDHVKPVRTFVERQCEINSIEKNHWKKRQTEIEMNPKEEYEQTDVDIENIVKKYRQNRKKKVSSKSSAEVPNRETVTQQSLRECRTSEMNGRECADLMELVNYFFGERRDDHSGPLMKRYSEYEKEGAIPKRMAKMESKTPKTSVSKSKEEPGSSKNENQLRDEEIVRTSTETYLQPFFYVVPENPCPNFFLPRGSYYVIPKAPDSSIEFKIVFHPERGEISKRQKNTRDKVEPKSREDPAKLNNLSKNFLENTDSHLNIGPLDVKISETSNNMETSFHWEKVYEKGFKNGDLSGSPGEAEAAGKQELLPDAVWDEDAELLDLQVREDRLNDVIARLTSELPDLTPWRAESLAEEFLDDEPRLECFIASERLKAKMEEQFQMMLLALPDSNPAEIRKKCDGFKGDEVLVNAYVVEAQKESRIQRLVMDLQFMFPDADPNFLRDRLEQIKDNEDALSRFSEELLEKRDYPKITDDPQTAERKRLWRRYVANFNVENYIRDVPDPEALQSSTEFKALENIDLVYKYLKAKYPYASDSELHNFNLRSSEGLIKTCMMLNRRQHRGDWESSIRNEAFSENFLKTICYIEHKNEIDSFLLEMEELKQIEILEARENDCFLSCPLCVSDDLVVSEVLTCPEGHVFCKNCIRSYVSVKMGEGVYKFFCPSENCGTFFNLSSLENILSETVVLNIIKKQQAEEISTAEVEGLETCPYCEFAYIPNPEDKIFKCQNSSCLIETCRNCHEKNHIPLRCEEVERPIDLKARIKIEETMTNKLVRVCPQCKKKTVKIDGCNKMACSCGALFCYICRQLIKGYDHFKKNGCPLHSNNTELHERDVAAEGIRTRDAILRENPHIRLQYDPTIF